MDREIHPGVRRRRLTSRIAFGALLGLGGLALLASLPGWLRPAVQRTRIRVAAVERGRLEATVEASGTVRPVFEKVLTSPIDTRVLRVLRRPGEEVRAGDPLLELDTATSRLDLERLQERLAQKRNEQEQVRLALEKTLADLESRVQTGRLDVEILQYRVEQQRVLRAQGLIAEAALREVEVEARKAAIVLAQTEDAVETERRSAEARLAGLALDIGILEKERVEAARLLERATARAESSGVLTWIVEEEGAAIRTGDVLARVADLDTFRVEGSVSDIHAPRLRPGLPVRVRLDDVVLPGRLDSIDPTIDRGVVRFHVSLDQPDHAILRNNLTVDLLVVVQARDDVLKVRKFPYGRGSTVEPVFVVRGDRAVRTEVRLGLSGYEEFEVLDGLREGDRVIVSDMSDYLHLDSIEIR
jgi:HlyD family secretion protein